jgi:hypothetical protein
MFAIVGATVVLTLAGCGGTDSGKTTQTPPPDATQEVRDTPNETATATVDKAADKRIASSALLTLNDFPSGWTQADEKATNARQALSATPSRRPKERQR